MEAWLPSLITATPQEGYELAIKLSRMAVKYTQPSAEVRAQLRPVYEKDADSLTAVSQVVAINSRPWLRPTTTGSDARLQRHLCAHVSKM